MHLIAKNFPNFFAIWQIRTFTADNMTKLSYHTLLLKPGCRFAALLLPVNYYIPD
jgi:hypothetical protein